MTASLGTLRGPQSLAVALLALGFFAEQGLAEQSSGLLVPASPSPPLITLEMHPGADGTAALTVTAPGDTLQALSAPTSGDYALRILNAVDGGVQMLRAEPIGAEASGGMPSATLVSLPVSDDPAAQRVEISIDGNLSGAVTADSNLVWVSSIDGVLGTGASLTLDPLALSEGVHQLRLAGRDSSGRSSTATARVQTRRVVSSQQPVAMAGDDRIVGVNSLVRLDGTGSFDPDEERIEYDWRQVAGPVVRLSDSSNVQPTFRAPNVADDTTLTFELFVFDDTLLSQPDQVNITVSTTVVSSSAPAVPAASTPAGQAAQSSGGGGNLFGLLPMLAFSLGFRRWARGRPRRYSASL